VKSIKPFGDSTGFGKEISCPGKKINYSGKEIVSTSSTTGKIN